MAECSEASGEGTTSSSSYSTSSRSSILPAAPSQRSDDKQTALFGVFRKHYSKLEMVMSTCVTTMTSKLYSANLVSEDVQDQVVTGQDSDTRKASKVLHSVKQQMKVDPGKLRMLIKVLREEPVFDDLTKEITSEYLNSVMLQ